MSIHCNVIATTPIVTIINYLLGKANKRALSTCVGVTPQIPTEKNGHTVQEPPAWIRVRDLNSHVLIPFINNHNNQCYIKVIHISD